MYASPFSLKVGSIVFLAFYLLSCGSTLKKVTTYYLNSERKRIDSEYREEIYFVDKKTKHREGIYQRYGKSWWLVEEGRYLNGEKVGIWKLWNSEDKIWIHYDYDNYGLAKPIIPRKYTKYPMFLAEEMVVLPSGVMKIYFKFDDNCSLIESKIIKGVHPKLDSIILQNFQRYTILKNKYDQSIDECNLSQDSTITIEFTGG